MNVRPAEPDDRNRIGAIARDSLQSSYALSPQEIETILAEEFDDAALADLLDDADTRVVVVDETVDGTEVVSGFVTVEQGAKATIRWLHVDPEVRGRGIATAMIERVREHAAGGPIAATILEDAVEGGEFLEGFGLEQGGYEEITLGDEAFAVIAFTEGEASDRSNEPKVPVPESVAMDGEDRPVDRDDGIPGREAPFFSVYDATGAGGGAVAYGYFCSQCGSTDVSADGLDRLECGECGNAHLADEWDDAYL